MRPSLKQIAIVLAIAYVCFVVGNAAIHRKSYPYGPSHSCDSGLYLSLLNYASRHGGWFPDGELTPEASLSLLHFDQPGGSDAEILRGKTVPLGVVQERFDRREMLTPETCGWHYVSGLRSDDDPRLALFWDKVGLGHNGEQLPDGNRTVCLIRGRQDIRGADWPKFLLEQERLRDELLIRWKMPCDALRPANLPPPLTVSQK
ncbi:MAG: hypothetical protein SH850_14770 [Planctomycetaceae bacterium]|nr:hypothetical protein [Planctomycetaceae bacterium]